MIEIKDPIGLIAFLSDGYKLIIIEVTKEHLVGRCNHGDIFYIPLYSELYQEVKYKNETK
jgi:hypothetical protein